MSGAAAMWLDMNTAQSKMWIEPNQTKMSQ